MNKMEEILINEGLSAHRYIMDGLQKCFTQGFWSNPYGQSCLIACVEHQMYNVEGLTRAQAQERLTHKYMIKIKLATGLKNVYNNSIVELFLDVFPECTIWDIPRHYKGFWTDKRKYEFAKWFIEEHLGLDKSTIHEMDTADILSNSKYKTVVKHTLEGVANLICTVYPDLDIKKIERDIRANATSNHFRNKRENKKC